MYKEYHKYGRTLNRNESKCAFILLRYIRLTFYDDKTIGILFFIFEFILCNLFANRQIVQSKKVTTTSHLHFSVYLTY